MAGSSLLALIDDIATLLDDVAVLSKVAVKKTAGVLGDDLALNAEQVSGVRAERELPVVWAVAKGSFKNKFILVPAALLISAVAPWAVLVCLMIGGLFLCYEGFEKIAHKVLHHDDEDARNEKLQALSDPSVDLVALEETKIKGAIRTDFILSAEIIVITLGTVQEASFGVQVAIVSGLALLITAGVYGIVAAIVKIDDAGLYLLQNAADNAVGKVQALFGKGLLRFAPILMKTLSIVGTAAMFLVGGGIIIHGIPAVHHLQESLLVHAGELHTASGFVTAITPTLYSAVVGIIAGALTLCAVSLFTKVKSLVK
ncbi:hypothetical protein A9Q99_15015 [Gammaproteobacteria bacterium 45_16_T64]|nr:hypothetical protein A9Q99_15015 [Gammaproteobacteria bacterium 45_16_T64]